MRNNQTIGVYGLLLAIWIMIAIWQVVEHDRIDASARAQLLDRTRDISHAISIPIRSEGRFNIVRQPRLEAALQELIEASELRSVALINAGGDVVASAGQPLRLNMQELLKTGAHWDKDAVAVLNLVNLGAGVEDRKTSRTATIVLPAEDLDQTSLSLFARRPTLAQTTTSLARDGQTTLATARSERRGRRRFWGNEEQYRQLLKKRGLHGFVLQISTDDYTAEVARDGWLRLMICAVALVAAAGLGVAWRNRERSAALQLRLIRASEINSHLREMNVAAAGLAHETRNPLNIVRGLAQMISREPEASAEIHAKSGGIIEEVDRVTSRLNEFIYYSKPREARPAPTFLAAVARDVARTLETDREDKAIAFSVSGPDLAVEADESLLRQVLFNLILNAFQSVGQGGRVEVALERDRLGQVSLEVRDNGPGVPAEAREDIFRPYYTTHEGGTGLGLAVVRQIVLAHHWEISYISGENGGARFRISGMKGLQKIS